MDFFLQNVDKTNILSTEAMILRAMATDNPQNRQDIRKVALVLLSLPHQQRCQLLDKLNPQQADAVIAEMNALDSSASPVEQESAIREFKETILPTISHKKRQTSARQSPFQFLYHLESEQILELIEGEKPQTIAIVLAQLPVRKAADVLALLPHDKQLPVARRIAFSGEAEPEAVAELAEGLKRQLHHPEEQLPKTEYGVSVLVRILNAMPPMVERRLLSELAVEEPQLSLRIRQTMFGPEVAAHDTWAAEIAC